MILKFWNSKKEEIFLSSFFSVVDIINICASHFRVHGNLPLSINTWKCMWVMQSVIKGHSNNTWHSRAVVFNLFQVAEPLHHYLFYCGTSWGNWQNLRVPRNPGWKTMPRVRQSVTWTFLTFKTLIYRSKRSCLKERLASKGTCFLTHITIQSTWILKRVFLKIKCKYERVRKVQKSVILCFELL